MSATWADSCPPPWAGVHNRARHAPARPPRALLEEHRLHEVNGLASLELDAPGLRSLRVTAYYRMGGEDLGAQARGARVRHHVPPQQPGVAPRCGQRPATREGLPVVAHRPWLLQRRRYAALTALHCG
jgi:hypothetical protein